MQTRREAFDGKNRLDDFLVKTTDVGGMRPAEKAVLFAKFNRFGAAILEHDPSDNPRKNLIDLGGYFGNIVGHDRAGDDGVTRIANLKGFDGYLGASNADHPLHTGGVYSDTPPIIILLQCIRQSSIGGETTLVSSKNICDHIRKFDPQGFDTLSKSGSLTIKRGKAQASRPVFDKSFLGNGGYLFTFRCDNVIEFGLKPASLVTTVAEIKRFIDAPENQIRFRLRENQILIADNSSVMHARTAFPDGEPRELLRLTLDGKSKETNYPLTLGFH